jgi:pimeloyl-ACP methyl ester carboxylesterase
MPVTAAVALALVALELVLLAVTSFASYPAVRAGLMALALLAAVAARRRRGTTRLRLALVTGPAGLVALGLGLATAVTGIAIEGPSAVRAVGAAGTIAGAVLVVVALRALLTGRRRAVQVVAAALALYVVLQWVIWPAVGAGLASHAGHGTAPAASTLHLPGARDISFPARDGTSLAGWYVPGRTGAAVILLHGSHGSRADTSAHLRLLARAGFAVLAYDARGHGRSDGTPNALGWKGADDVAGAYAFLRTQPGVDPRRVAALGLSMGAETALRAAAGGLPLAGVVADGAGASTLTDQRLLVQGPTTPVFVSGTWLMMRATELVSGDREPPALTSVVGGMRAPVLLVASGSSDEYAFDRILRQRIGARAQLWQLADAAHTRGLATHPVAYASRTIRFLEAATSR